MEHMNDPQTAYLELLTSLFDKLKKQINGRKHKDLKDQIQAVSDSVKSDVSLDANKYFVVFKQALDTKVTKTLEIILYYMQKLMGYGFLKGNCEDLTQAANRKLIDSIVESICACIHDRDDNVQLQVIKALLTAVTSFHCEVHDRSLLEAFRACYHIHITSKNAVNQTTAKASLTQMLHIVFQKMERSTQSTSDESLAIVLRRCTTSILDFIEIYQKRLEHTHNPPLRAVPFELHPSDPLYASLATPDLQNELGKPSGKFGWCVNCRETADCYCRLSRDPICSEECKISNLKLLEAAGKGTNAESCYYNDALLLFKTVCTLSSKELSTADSLFTYKSKVLSLELVLAITDNPGVIFSSSRQFIDLIKSTLCESLLKNSLASDKTIFTLSLSIFVSIVTNFKDSLKREIGVFMNEIFIRMLESDSASVHQRLLVVEVFYRITQNPKTALELFLNYDCSVDEIDIFARMIDILRKLAVGRSKGEDAFQEKALKQTTLQTLVCIMKAQTAWLEQETTHEAPVEEEESTESPEDQFEKNRQLKNKLSIAVAKFNIKPSSGLLFLAENNHLDIKSPVDIANFLKNTVGISKTMIGEYLGANKEPNTQVLHEYADLFEFKDKSLLSSLREFLLSFRIPGEGQVVDRIMEKFAERYCNANPGAFASPDSAFILSFAIMMLQTDLHNPSVKEKMKLNQFCMMISQDPTIPRSLLEEIYEEVKNNPFTLPEDDTARAQQESAGKKRHEVFAIESELIYQRSQEEFKKKGAADSTYYMADHITHLKTMFEALWHPLLAAFSIVLEEAEDAQLWKLSLDGLLACIKISCRFGMSLELEVFLSSLAKFSSLIYLHNQLSEKNIECMKALVEIAKIEAGYLRGSWLHVLKCMSKLDYYHLISSPGLYEGPVTEFEVQTSEFVLAQITPAEIDYIFSLSKGLDSAAIVDFVSTLVEVSKEELAKVYPQTFSLQALVNVADMNMDRMRFVWGQLWHCLKGHFSAAGVHPKRDIASFAVDSLKQLASKFLKKEELTNFNFQKDFLQPFETILKQSDDDTVRELVVACMGHFVFTMIDNIKSGWHSVFDVFSIAARTDLPALIQHIMTVMEHLVPAHLPKVHSNFGELISTLSTLAGTSVDMTSVRCIELMYMCVGPIASGEVSKDLWTVLLSGIASRILDRRYELQTKALSVLFQLFREYGDIYEQEDWKLIYSGVILPIFDDVVSGEEVDKDWLNNTCIEALQSFVDLIGERFNSLKFLVNDFLLLLEKAVLTLYESSAKTSINTLQYFGSSIGHLFNEEVWMSYIQSFCRLFARVIPSELMQENIEKLEISHSIDKCFILYYLVSSCGQVLNSNKIDEQAMVTLVPSVQEAYHFARDFNRNVERRNYLWNNGFLANAKGLPGLFKLEKDGLACLLELLFRLDQKQQDKMYEVCRDVLREIGNPDQLSETRKDEIKHIVPLVSSLMLPGLKNDLKSALRNVGDELVGIVMVEDIDLRLNLKDLLTESLSLIHNFK